MMTNGAYEYSLKKILSNKLLYFFENNHAKEKINLSFYIETNHCDNYSISTEQQSINFEIHAGEGLYAYLHSDNFHNVLIKITDLSENFNKKKLLTIMNQIDELLTIFLYDFSNYVEFLTGGITDEDNILDYHEPYDWNSLHEYYKENICT